MWRTAEPYCRSENTLGKIGAHHPIAQGPNVYTIAEAKRKWVNCFLIARKIGRVLLHQGSGKTKRGSPARMM